MSITSKQLLDVALVHNDPCVHTPATMRLLLTELHKTDKRLEIDIDAIANRDEYNAYVLCCFLQEKGYNIDVESGIVHCTTIYEFYHTVNVMFQVIENYQAAGKVCTFVSFLSRTASASHRHNGHIYDINATLHAFSNFSIA